MLGDSLFFDKRISGLRVGGYMNPSLASWILTLQFSVQYLEQGLILNFEGSEKSKNWGKETLTLNG